MNKYNQLIEHIINDNEEAAKALFHQIVVEKSRDIYESLMDEELGGNQAQGFINDVTDEVQGDERGIGEDDEEGAEFSLDGEDEDDSDLDGEVDEFGADDIDGDEETFGGDDEISDKIDELEAQLADLKDLLSGEGSGSGDDLDSEETFGDDDGMGDSDFDADDEVGASDQGFDDAEDEVAEDEVAEGKNPFAKSGSGKSGSGKSGSGKSGSGKSGSGVKESRKLSDVEIMKEYVDKIGEIYKQEPAQGEGKTVGTGGDAPTVNKKSVSLEKGPDFGGTSDNIAKGGAEQDPDGKQYKKPNNLYSKGEGEIEVAKRNVNKPGGNKGAQNFYSKKETTYEKNKGAEGQTTDGKVSVEKKSILKHIGK